MSHFDEDLERVDSISQWYNNKLVKFSKFLVMPRNGFENEILLLFKKMEVGRCFRGLSPQIKRRSNPLLQLN